MVFKINSGEGKILSYGHSAEIKYEAGMLEANVMDTERSDYRVPAAFPEGVHYVSTTHGSVTHNTFIDGRKYASDTSTYCTICVYFRRYCSFVFLSYKKLFLLVISCALRGLFGCFAFFTRRQTICRTNCQLSVTRMRR